VHRDYTNKITLDLNSYTQPEILKTIFTEGIRRNLAIALWKLPGSEEVNLIVSFQSVKHPDKCDLEEIGSGFIITTFPDRQGIENLFLSNDLHYSTRHNSIKTNEAKNAQQEEIEKFLFSLNNLLEHRKRSAEPIVHLPTSENSPANFSTGAESYKKLVAKALDLIDRKVIHKVVPSKVKSISKPPVFESVEFFLKLSSTYPETFVSLVSIPQYGTWIGASPENLISVDENNIFKTASLAGTKPFREEIPLKDVSWKQKEIEEQAIVSRYIINCFKKIRLREFDEIGPRTVRAGNLVHLKTDYLVDMSEVNFPQLGTVMLELLHPTSAVCGMPKEAALEFLHNEEEFKRIFYSGYLGPVNIYQRSNIFVNLRCMQVRDADLLLYSGAGVTADSDPEKEWEETELKCETLLSRLS